MTSKEISIPSSWRVKGKVSDVYDIVSTPTDFVRWWSSVYLEVEELEPGAEDGVGRIVRLHTKGKLPYTINWVAKATQIEKPHRIVLEATGDLQGRGEWRLEQSGEWVDIGYSWTVVITKPWMRFLLPLLKPVFVANHRWAMQQGEAGLRKELARRSVVVDRDAGQAQLSDSGGQR